MRWTKERIYRNELAKAVERGDEYPEKVAAEATEDVFGEMADREYDRMREERHERDQR